VSRPSADPLRAAGGESSGTGRFVGPSPTCLARLRAAILDLRSFLVRHREQNVAEWLIDAEQRLSTGDMSAIGMIIIETTGGMGSLNDLILTPAGGNDMDGFPTGAVNLRLRRLVDDLRTRTMAARDTPWFSQLPEASAPGASTRELPREP
jgi:hypothetical protein